MQVKQYTPTIDYSTDATQQEIFLAAENETLQNTIDQAFTLVKEFDLKITRITICPEYNTVVFATDRILLDETETDQHIVNESAQIYQTLFTLFQQNCPGEYSPEIFVTIHHPLKGWGLLLCSSTSPNPIPVYGIYYEDVLPI